ncbi:hypothetical protein IAT38_007414 [Cryptococcus sp. DSM 104549]
MDFLQPVLSTLRNDFNLGNKHFDVVFGNRHPLSMSGHFMKAWGCLDASKPLRAGKDGEEDGAVVTEIEGGAAGRVEKDEEPELEGGKGVMLLSPWNNGDPATSSLRSRHKGQSETSPDICKLGKQSNGTAGLKEAQKTSKGDEVGEGENGVKGGEEGGEAMVTGKQKKNLRRKERREKKEKKGNDMS